MKKKLQRGKPLEELVKGSMDYTMEAIRGAFMAQFNPPDANGVTRMPWYVMEVFADYVIVRDWRNESELKSDEYYKVTYSKSGDAYTFAARDAWEVVELAYQPQTMEERAPSTAGVPSAQGPEKGKGAARRGKRMEERVGRVELAEAEEGKARRIRIRELMVADVVNGNGRRYPSGVLRSAVEELRSHLNESAGQGRAVQLLGEAEHPTDKGGRPNLLETVVKWDEVSFDGTSVSLGGNLLGTSKGKDIQAMMEGGVTPGGSVRGYYDFKSIKEGGQRIEEVTEVHLTGADLVLEPSFQNAEALLESIQGDEEMNWEELLKLLKEHPEAFDGLTEAKIKAMTETQLQAVEAKVRAALGIDEKADLAEALKATTEKARKFDEGQRKQTVEAAIAEATKDLPYGKANASFVEAIKAANPQDEKAVKSLVEAKKAEYDALFADKALQALGYRPSTAVGITQVAPVLEVEAGTPEYARGAFMLAESIRKAELRGPRDPKAEKTPNQIFTEMILARFDQVYKAQLMAESRMLEEAEITTDLNLPYSVSRAIIEEAYPSLVAAGIFDVGVIDTSPTRLYFEAFSGDSGYTASVTGETATADLDAWVDLDHGAITPGTFTMDGGYTEGDDFVVNYADGKFMALTAGDISDSASVTVNYTYTAIQQGEMQPIERGEIQLTFKVVSAVAKRLADQISREAIVFSRSQLGQDVVARTMASLVRQLRRKIDQGLLYMAYSAVLGVANNSAGTWTAGTLQADYAELARLIGAAKVLVGNRFYTPTFALMSLTNADRLSNWDGFSRTGFPNAVLNAAGFAGGAKGLAIFASTEFPDTHVIVGNRELVMHRVFQPLQIRGPFPVYATTGDVTRLVAADQYYAEEFNLTDAPVFEKGAYIAISEGS